MNRLKELRQEKELSQKEIALELQVPLRTYQRWENGESQIKPDKAQALADYFGVSVGYLLGYTEDRKIYDDEYTSSIENKTYTFSGKRMQEERTKKFLTEFILILQNNSIFLSNSEILQVHNSIMELDANNENTLKGQAFLDGFTNVDSPFRKKITEEYSFVFADFDNSKHR